MVIIKTLKIATTKCPHSEKYEKNSNLNIYNMFLLCLRNEHVYISSSNKFKMMLTAINTIRQTD